MCSVSTQAEKSIGKNSFNALHTSTLINIKMNENKHFLDVRMKEKYKQKEIYYSWKLYVNEEKKSWRVSCDTFLHLNF